MLCLHTANSDWDKSDVAKWQADGGHFAYAR